MSMHFLQRSIRSWVGIVGLLITLGPTVALGGDLRAHFDRGSVHMGDTVTLVIETDGGTLGQPDLSPLSADFDVLGTSQSTQISIVNGQRTDTVRLLVTLSPKSIGAIEVPPLDVGGETTPPLTLQVSEAPAGAIGTPGDDLFVEVELGADADSVMVQQQVPLTVRLFTSMPLVEGSLGEPRPTEALVQRLGEDRRYETRRSGRTYQVVERRYAIAAEKSGELRIPPVVFKGSVRGANSRGGGFGGRPFDDPFFDRFLGDGFLSRGPFGMFDSGSPVRAQSRAVTLDVKARPEGYPGAQWIPARDLTVVDSWAEGPPGLLVGVPVIRTLTLEAKGLFGPQIPEIELPAGDGMRIYRDKTQTESRADGETVYGVSHQGLTLIPSRAGELAVPEVRVGWWDTAAQEARVATVPGWTLNVTGGGAEQPSSAPDAAPEQAPIEQTTPAPEGPDARLEAPGINTKWLLATLALLGFLAILGFWLIRRRAVSDKPRTVAKAGPSQTSPLGAEAKRSLRAACATDDAQGAARALLQWAKATWPGDAPRNLGALSARLVRGANEVRELERRIYAPESGSWSGAPLWRALQAGLEDTSGGVEGQDDTLEPLYPRRN